jgi:hypothetical protein
MKCFNVFQALLILILWVSCTNIPGSFAYAERYSFQVSESRLITIVRKFRKLHTQFNLPIQTGVADGKIDSLDHWYHIYFYYPKEDQIVKAWIQGPLEGGNKATLALVAVNEGLQIPNWRYINKDFDYKENIKQKQLFEQRILAPIRRMIEENLNLY